QAADPACLREARRERHVVPERVHVRHAVTERSCGAAGPLGGEDGDGERGYGDGGGRTGGGARGLRRSRPRTTLRHLRPAPGLAGTEPAGRPARDHTTGYERKRP